MNLLPLPAFSDNYVWMLYDDSAAIVVDPGAAEPVLEALQQLGVTLKAILVTHHHGDHIGAVRDAAQAPRSVVYGKSARPFPSRLCQCSRAPSCKCPRWVCRCA